MFGGRSFETFVALRYLRARRTTGMITIISIISILGITVGVAALIIVMSVFNGFNRFAIDQLVSYDPHIRISASDGRPVDTDKLLPYLQSPEIATISPFIEGRSAVIHDRKTGVATIRGIAPGVAAGQIAEKMRRTIPGSRAGEGNGIILGSALASNLGLFTGDTLSIVGRQGLELALTQVAQPVTIEVPITSTFSLNQEYDAHVGFVPLETARKIFEIKSGAMGIEIRLHDFERSVALANELNESLPEGFLVESWQDLHRDLYGAMELERWSAFVIVLLIVIVAVFNVLGSLTMTVIEKRRDIGILKTLGAPGSGILRTFIVEGVLIGLIGTSVGVALGLGLCWAQATYSLVELDTSRYLLGALPVEIRPVDVIIVVLSAMTLATLSAIYPAARAAALDPADAIRWE